MNLNWNRERDGECKAIKRNNLAKSRKNNEFLVNPSEKSSFHSELANNKWIHYKFAQETVIHGGFSKMIMDQWWINGRDSTFRVNA